MNQRHEFADILIAIAEGKEVEFRATRAGGDWYKFSDTIHCWPGHIKNIEWRVKPQIQKRKTWINIYPSHYGENNYVAHASKTEADGNASPLRIANVS